MFRFRTESRPRSVYKTEIVFNQQRIGGKEVRVRRERAAEQEGLGHLHNSRDIIWDDDDVTR